VIANRHGRVATLAVAAVGLAMLASACSSSGSSSSSSAPASGSASASAASSAAGGSESINVLMVGNPQMTDIQKLTADNFTAKTGITVNYTVLPENELRDKVTQDVATGAGQYDVVTIGMYEVPIWGANGWLINLTDMAKGDTAYNYPDILPSMVSGLSGTDGNLYASPFYGESSFLMYRKDLFEKAGLTMPENPTWEQVGEFAKKLDDKKAGMAGICLRGLPGWGEVFAPLTTVVNTYGGTWFEKDWAAKVNAPEFEAATQFYVDLVKNYGEPGAPQAGFTECLNAVSQNKAAMWYDATSAAGSLEDPAVSKVAGKMGYVAAPVNKTAQSGWLWAWAWAMPSATKKQDAAWQFMSWASSAEYENLVGETLGWARVPSGKRASTYDNPKYQDAAKAFYEITLSSISEADPLNPGVQPRPAPGIQFVAIPEFADLGTKVAQEVSAAIAGDQTVKEALDKGQALAEQSVTQVYQNQ
jgi:sorbitol/mannitol transport system substrate-binding protein